MVLGMVAGSWVLPSGSPSPLAAQVMSGGQGSLTSDGRTSWDSEYLAPPSTHTSHSLPGSSMVFTTGCPAQPAHVRMGDGAKQKKGQGALKEIPVGEPGSPMVPHVKRDPSFLGKGAQTGESSVQPPGAM